MNENTSYIKGIIGGVIGGVIATIPWILMYVYGEMILSLLAILIAMGVLKGYQLMKGKVDKKLPIIIIVISLLCVTISTLVVIPLLLLAKENLPSTIDNLKILYGNETFQTALLKDFAISVVFTALGISGVITNVKKQLNEGKSENIKATIKNENKEEDKKNKDKKSKEKDM